MALAESADVRGALLGSVRLPTYTHLGQESMRVKQTQAKVTPKPNQDGTQVFPFWVSDQSLGVEAHLILNLRQALNGLRSEGTAVN